MVSANYLDPFLFAVLPYIVAIAFVPVTVHRYRARGFTYSSLSSQFLENQQHFWALVPFHYGILVVTAGHLAAFLMPKQILVWNAQPLRLYLLEITGLAFAALALIGLSAALFRRFNTSKVRRVTTVHDWILFLLLFVQIASGIGVAVFHPWGSSWFASALTPYLWSLIKLSPDLTAVSAMPLLVKFHIVTAYLVVGYFPFTRLVHVLVIPNPYLWRKPQVVRWYRRPAEAAHKP
ncbi:MAG TPA: respiratory nitrate reductase subunit gamma [Bryobacteraceae bacterium]|nr:respiratory nitrate reductase subunit gamma [Bryobacteraceae bacterium]